MLDVGEPLLPVGVDTLTAGRERSVSQDLRGRDEPQAGVPEEGRTRRSGVITLGDRGAPQRQQQPSHDSSYGTDSRHQHGFPNKSYPILPRILLLAREAVNEGPEESSV